MQDVDLSEGELRVLLDHAPIGVIVLDEQLRIRGLNRIARAVFDHQPDIIGRSFHELLIARRSRQTADGIAAILRQVIATGAPYFAPEGVEEDPALKQRET